MQQALTLCVGSSLFDIIRCGVVQVARLRHLSAGGQGGKRAFQVLCGQNTCVPRQSKV